MVVVALRIVVFVCALFGLMLGVARADERWLVVNDIHLDPFSRAQTVSEPGQDTNLALLRSALAEMRRVDASPDVVLIGGDILTHHFPEKSRAAHGSGASERDALTAARTVAGLFATEFPKARFAVVLGNNDDPCGDYHSEFGGDYLASLTRIWAPLVNRGGAAPEFTQTFARGGYGVTSVLNGRARVVMFNDVYGSLFSQGSCTRTLVDPGRTELAWLHGLLRATPTKTVLLVHIPTGIDPVATATSGNFLGVNYMHGRFEGRLAATLAGSNLAWIVTGHAHRNDLRLFNGVPEVVLSSLSPIYRNNPAFYVLDVASDATLRNIESYDYNYDNERWQRETDFSRAWGVGAINADAAASIHARIGDDVDARELWATRYVAWGSRIDDINRSTWRIYWCAQTLRGAPYAACAGTARRFTSVAVVVGGCALLVVALVVVVVVNRRRARAR